MLEFGSWGMIENVEVGVKDQQKEGKYKFVPFSTILLFTLSLISSAYIHITNIKKYSLKVQWS